MGTPGRKAPGLGMLSCERGAVAWVARFTGPALMPVKLRWRRRPLEAGFMLHCIMMSVMRRGRQCPCRLVGFCSRQAMLSRRRSGNAKDPHAREDRLADIDRKSTRLNSSHQIISYAVFCLK